MAAAPPRPGDPAAVGGYTITGRLGQGGQGVVLLGEGPDGERVAIKLIQAGLADGDARGAWAAEIGLARRVKAFCTAQVLDTGESDGVPYIVSEFVDGPSLAQVIKERGPLGGAELRRVAIGTLTALAAIHQAGVVHQDFKPGNVLLSRDGPRVIDFGISRALDAAERTGEDLLGTPPFMAPEQFAGLPSGPPADLFAWGSTIVCAATGRPPFGAGDLPAVISGILHAEPDLGALDGELRELVARCLAKDPAARPTATQALLTLLGHPVPEVRLLAKGQESAAPPARRRRWPVVLAAAACAVALAVTAGVLLTRTGPAPPAAPAPRGGRMPLTSTSEVRIPGTGITLHENPADPVSVSSYVDGRDKTSGTPSYVRDPRTRRFAYHGGFQYPVTSPGGGYVASVSVGALTDPTFETIRIVDRVRGQEVQIRSVARPAYTASPAWRGDGRLLLLTIYPQPGTGRKETDGFVVVDPAARTASVVSLPGGHDSAYQWGADGSTVLHQGAGGTVAVHDLKGRVLRSFRGVGQLLAMNAARSWAGTVFGTTCPGLSVSLCLWDAASGARRASVPLPERVVVRGWLDDLHLLAVRSGPRTTEVIMLDRRGAAVRTLAEGPTADLGDVTLWFTAN
ncbi:hypothetical protein DP939_13850 [Spongiactinospora rosea]|uniref:Protein kinase domain-containing protein n=1 Tax=Spongiactinospora rosea TaxID=2248750 RepID=A0A366M2E8_9ACTN|nr:serine/threonine-protein kinase [Spongiactinospora rosea]RBQ19789.1 hypothetical protein DP939_13850 [Spongiactinospora rosea]